MLLCFNTINWYSGKPVFISFFLLVVHLVVFMQFLCIMSIFMQFTLNFFSSRKKALDIFRVRSISKALLFIVFTRFFFRLNSVFYFGNLLLFQKVGDDVDVAGTQNHYYVAGSCRFLNFFRRRHEIFHVFGGAHVFVDVSEQIERRFPVRFFFARGICRDEPYFVGSVER